jgi:hypothetical protein
MISFKVGTPKDTTMLSDTFLADTRHKYGSGMQESELQNRAVLARNGSTYRVTTYELEM